jgi:glycyl-tRNA synthetase
VSSISVGYRCLSDRDAYSSTTIVADGREFQLTPDLLTIKQTVVKQSSMHVSYHYCAATQSQVAREFVPNVIEPSFGLGRILYMLLEHSFWTREDDEQKGVRNCLPRVPARYD